MAAVVVERSIAIHKRERLEHHHRQKWQRQQQQLVVGCKRWHQNQLMLHNSLGGRQVHSVVVELAAERTAERTAAGQVTSTVGLYNTAVVVAVAVAAAVAAADSSTDCSCWLAHIAPAGAVVVHMDCC